MLTACAAAGQVGVARTHKACTQERGTSGCTYLNSLWPVIGCCLCLKLCEGALTGGHIPCIVSRHVLQYGLRGICGSPATAAGRDSGRASRPPMVRLWLVSNRSPPSANVYPASWYLPPGAVPQRGLCARGRQGKGRFPGTGTACQDSCFTQVLHTGAEHQGSWITAGHLKHRMFEELHPAWLSLALFSWQATTCLPALHLDNLTLHAHTRPALESAAHQALLISTPCWPVIGCCLHLKLQGAGRTQQDPASVSRHIMHCGLGGICRLPATAAGRDSGRPSRQPQASLWPNAPCASHQVAACACSCPWHRAARPPW